ncbi:hypothetical protein ABK040_002887 [Willaertia magna]
MVIFYNTTPSVVSRSSSPLSSNCSNSTQSSTSSGCCAHYHASMTNDNNNRMMNGNNGKISSRIEKQSKTKKQKRSLIKEIIAGEQLTTNQSRRGSLSSNNSNTLFIDCSPVKQTNNNTVNEPQGDTTATSGMCQMILTNWKSRSETRQLIKKSLHAPNHVTSNHASHNNVQRQTITLPTESSSPKVNNNNSYINMYKSNAFNTTNTFQSYNTCNSVSTYSMDTLPHLKTQKILPSFKELVASLNM